VKIGHGTPGRYCALAGIPEESDLRQGLDFRLPQYRREVFLRFYEFHLKYRSHPGCVYYLMPYLAERYGWDEEARLWFAFINGNTQNPVTSLIIFRRFPTVHGLCLVALKAWWQEFSRRLAFDIDRRYHRTKFVEAVERYQGLLLGGTQRGFFHQFLRGDDLGENFARLWWVVREYFLYFGRLSAFSYLEYLRVMGLPLDCNDLFLEDLSGSKSHRNGLCKVLGRDDLDWHEGNSTGFDGHYSPAVMRWLKAEAAGLLKEAGVRLVDRDFSGDVSYFTMESALCTYKSWHRPNRRYPNVYNDMLHGRIRVGEGAWPEEDLAMFWEARRDRLPAHLRLEDNPGDVGVKPEKQNHYLLTGEPVMMDQDWPCFQNGYNDRVRKAGLDGSIGQGPVRQGAEVGVRECV